MDPSETELNAMSTLADVGNWAGTTGPLEESLLALLGRPTKLRDVAFIARTTWDRVVSGLTMEVTAATDTVPAITRPLNPTEESRIEIFRRACLLRLGIQPDHPGASGLPTMSVVPAGPGMAPGGGRGAGSPMSITPTRKLKLSSVVDPTLDAEIIHMEATELEQVYNDYRTKFGALPSQDVDPTNDQLSGLRQLIMSKALPYVDLSIWGPFGLRTLRKQVFTSYILNASTGEWSKKEAPGPPDVVAWEKSFRTYRVAMLLLQAIDSERIDSYIDHIKELHNRFGSECWGLIYRADVRMRSEHMERVKRELDTAPQYGYSSAAPWSAVFFASTKDAEFWSKEVIIPGTLLLAKGSTGPSKPNAATSDSSDGPATSKKPRTGRGKKRKYKGDDSVFDEKEKVYTHNRKKIEICKKYNMGKCGDGRPQGKCPNNRSHQCNKCMGPHPATKCTGGKR